MICHAREKRVGKSDSGEFVFRGRGWCGCGRVSRSLWGWGLVSVVACGSAKAGSFGKSSGLEMSRGACKGKNGMWRAKIACFSKITLSEYRASPCLFLAPHRPIRFFGTSSVADNAGLQNHAIRTSIGIHRSNAVTQQFLLCLAFRRQRSGDWCVRGASSDCLCGCETRGRIQTDAPATSLTPPFLQVCCASASSGGEIDAHAVPTGPVGKTRQTLRLLSMSVSGRLPGEELCGDSSSGDV